MSYKNTKLQGIAPAFHYIPYKGKGKIYVFNET